MSSSRTKNVSKNITVALPCQILFLLFTFVGRTFFIKILGAQYLGVNGLFTNILTILSFAELGIGNAIVFSMYKPLAVGDTPKLASLMALYKKAYRTIGIIVAVCGVCIAPFLGFIIKDAPDIRENITLIYLLFLTNTVASYFFVYKKSIIVADQKNYIILLVAESIHIFRTILQIIFLFLTHNYILYLLIQIGCTFIENTIASLIADKMYPFLKQKAQPLSKEESQGIFKNVRALALYKFGSVVLNGTDNILVSAMVGVTAVGLVSNYVLLTVAGIAILEKVTDAFTASVGNLNAMGSVEQKYDVFNKLFFVTVWIYGFASVGLFVVLNPFVKAWVGEAYLLDMVVVGAIVAEFYVKGVHSAAYTYRTTLGYFNEGKASALVAAGLNLVLSILLCRWIGLAGIFIATPIARMLSIGIVDPVLIFRNCFRKNPAIYYIKYASYALVILCIAVLCRWVVSFLTIGGWPGIFLQIAIVTVVFNACMLLIFGRRKMFRDLVRSVTSSIKGTKRKRV